MENDEIMRYQNINCEPISAPQRFDVDADGLAEALKNALQKTEKNLPKFVHLYPSACSEKSWYRAVPNATTELGSDWTAAFWTGMLWLSYEMSRNELFRAVAEAQFDDYAQRYDAFQLMNHHDMGFLFIPSIVAQYKLTGSRKARKLALKAADVLAGRFSERAGIIQVRDRDIQGAFIIDCSMNVPLLFWAAQQTGRHDYYVKGLRHMVRVAECMLRADGSSYQCFQIDEVTGQPVRGWQGQGYDDASCWARGQAWLIYGLALCYRYTKDLDFLYAAKCASNYFLNRLPSDLVCNWDLIFTQDEEQRDTSAAAIAACGLLELHRQLPAQDAERNLYLNAGRAITVRLAERYTADSAVTDGLLLHGVYCRDKGDGGLGDDECCIWGDYFYMEALVRLSQKDGWNPYW